MKLSKPFKMQSCADFICMIGRQLGWAASSHKLSVRCQAIEQPSLGDPLTPLLLEECNYRLVERRLVGRRVVVALTSLEACRGDFPNKARHLLVGRVGFSIEDQDRHIKCGAAQRATWGRRHRESPPQGPSGLRRQRELRSDWRRQGVRERFLPVPGSLPLPRPTLGQ